MFRHLKSVLTDLLLLCAAVMIAQGCSCSNGRSTIRDGQDQEPLSVFDELAEDMVFVESDSGDFYICRYEVTQGLWKEVMGDNPSEMQGDDLPVEQVNWDDCQRFIIYSSRKPRNLQFLGGIDDAFC